MSEGQRRALRLPGSRRREKNLKAGSAEPLDLSSVDREVLAAELEEGLGEGPRGQQIERRRQFDGPPRRGCIWGWIHFNTPGVGNEAASGGEWSTPRAAARCAGDRWEA